MASKQPIYAVRPRIFSSETIARMYPTAVRILSEIGLRVRHPHLLEAARRAGMRVVEDRAFPEKSTFADLVAENGPSANQNSQPEEPLAAPITLTIHNYSEKYHAIETDEIMPYTSERLIEATKLVDTCAARRVHSGAPGVPTDVPPYLRTVLQFKIGAQYSRTGRIYWDAQYARSLRYVMDMAEAVGHPIRTLPVFVNSPLCIGGESEIAVLEFRDRLESIRVSNISSAGLSAPIRIADAVTVGLAEVLGTAAVMRVATGLPIIWEIAVTGGSPQATLERWAAEEVSAFYHGKQPEPPEGTIFTGAEAPGIQAAAEKMYFFTYGALFGCRTFLGAGNLQGEIIWSGEQLMIDLEMRDYVQQVVSGIDSDFNPDLCIVETKEGVDLGIFLALESTARAYRQVTWFPHLFDRPDLRRRAKETVRQQLAEYDYALEPEITRELERIYERAERDLAYL